MNDTLKTLISRRSMRHFKKEQLLENELQEVLQAGVNAPTGGNRQSALMVVVQDEKMVAKLSAMNAAVLGKTDIDPFYGAPTVVIVLADTRIPTWKEDGSLVLGNLMNAAYSIGIGSCWIHRAYQVFESEEGKALLKEWGIPECYAGVGHCILGYPDGEEREITHREDYIHRV